MITSRYDGLSHISSPTQLSDAPFLIFELNMNSFYYLKKSTLILNTLLNFNIMNTNNFKPSNFIEKVGFAKL